jgi:hypothetical protein
MIKRFLDYIDESYLDSNNSPLYHFTTTWSLNQILKSNQLSVGYFNHNINGKILKIVSLTRNKKIDLDYKNFEVKICLDKDKLINKYKLKPYDFFNTDKRKWDPSRVNFYEFEEFSELNIEDLNKYILYIDFFDIDHIWPYLYDIKEYINKYSIECKINEKIIDINGL